MREFTCIVCPNGCHLTIDDNMKVSGNTCKKGEEFAIQEITNPTRNISSTCRTTFSFAPVVPVKTDKEIKKELIFDVMKEINKVVIDKRLKIGDIVIPNVLGTDTNIVITTNSLEEN